MKLLESESFFPRGRRAATFDRCRTPGACEGLPELFALAFRHLSRPAAVLCSIKHSRWLQRASLRSAARASSRLNMAAAALILQVLEASPRGWGR